MVGSAPCRPRLTCNVPIYYSPNRARTKQLVNGSMGCIKCTQGLREYTWGHMLNAASQPDWLLIHISD